MWTASFDLTAFYDSIDHNVLRHMLKEIGLDYDFCMELTNVGVIASHRNVQQPVPSNFGDLKPRHAEVQSWPMSAIERVPGQDWCNAEEGGAAVLRGRNGSLGSDR